MGGKKAAAVGQANDESKGEPDHNACRGPRRVYLTN